MAFLLGDYTISRNFSLSCFFLFPFTIGKTSRSSIKTIQQNPIEDIYFQQQQARNQNIHTGIKLESEKYTLFTGETFGSSTEKDVKELDKGYIISNISLNEGTTILFSPWECQTYNIWNFCFKQRTESY